MRLMAVDDVTKKETWDLGTGFLLMVHPRLSCTGRHCTFHYPVHSHMNDWPSIWRGARGILERICEHGVGHPDPSQFDYWKEHHMEYQAVHGCDGCCVA